MVERFVYYPNSQMIIDEVTGKHYSGNKMICDLLNQESDRFDDWFRVLEKYHIHSPEKLDKVLWNSRTW